MPVEARASYLQALRSLGVDAPESLLDRRDAWMTIDVERLGESGKLDGFESAVMRLTENV